MSVSSAKSAASSQRLGRERMPRTHQADALVAKQGTEDHVGMRLRPVVDDGEFRLTALEQRQRIDDETGDDVELHFGPQRPVGVHRRHQPIEAIVALHRNAQGPRMALGEARDVASRFGHLG